VEWSHEFFQSEANAGRATPVWRSSHRPGRRHFRPCDLPVSDLFEVADAYKKQTGVGLNYQSIGFRRGIKQIKAKTVTFGASDMR